MHFAATVAVATGRKPNNEQAVDTEGRTPLDLATDPAIRRMIKTEEALRHSGESFDLLGAVEVNDTLVGFLFLFVLLVLVA